MRKSSGREAARLRAGLLLRSRWRSAVALGVVAGLGGGVVVGLVSIARDTSSAIDRYVEHLGEPDVAVTICPPGTDAEAAENGACFVHDPVRELAALRRLPEVRAAARVSPTPVAVRVPGGEWRPSFAWVVHDDVELFEHPPLVTGRAAELGRPDETMVNEAMAELLDLAPGGHLEVAPLSPDEVSADSASLTPQLPVTDMEVAGVVRVGADLVEPQTQGSLATIEAAMFLGPAWADAMAASDYYRYQTGIGLWLDEGAEVETLVAEAAPGQFHVVDGGLTADDTAGPKETVDYQARAALAAAALLALAGMVLLGQILGRQARRELADAATLRALGMTRRGLTSSAVPRWIATAGVAGLVAAATAVLIRPLGPVGIARRAAGAGRGINLAVVGLGVLAVVGFVVGVGLLVTYRGTAARRSVRTRAFGFAPPSHLSAEASVGMALTVNAGQGRRSWAGPAVLGSAAAIAAVIAVPTLHSSLDHLTGEPSRYGVGWDAVATGVLGKAGAQWMAGELRSVEGTAAVATSWGTSNAAIDDRQLYLYAFDAVPGLPSGIVPTITAGRAPAATDEVALGAQSLADSGARIGDTVTVDLLDQEYPMRVVGTVVVNDNYETDPGRGGVVTADWLRAADPAGYPSDFMIRFAEGRQAEGLAALQQRFPGLVSAPLPPDDVVNLRRLESWPAVLAGLTMLMAGAAFVHALITSVRVQRHPLAVAKALGWSRTQVGRSIFWHASFLALPAILVGVPAGVVLGRWGWGVVSHSLGVPSVPVVPLALLVAIAVAALIAANVLAIWPSWRAAHIAAADALRSE